MSLAVWALDSNFTIVGIMCHDKKKNLKNSGRLLIEKEGLFYTHITRKKINAGLLHQQEKIWQENHDCLVNHAQEWESKERSEKEATTAYNIQLQKRGS